MTWRDRYQQASFRGVPFRVDDHGAGGGRRVVIHEFAGTDQRLVQDLGRATETLALRGYVIGPDYDLQRDALLEVLGQAGPGELVHPYLGTLQVQVLGYEVSERAQDGGVATFALQFVEVGAAPGILGTRAGARQAADSAADEALDAAEAGFDPAAVLEGMAEEVEAFSARLQAFSLSGPLATVARYRRLASRLADAVLSVVGFPLQQARLVRQAVVDLDNAVSSRRELLALHVELLGQRPKLRGGASAFARRRDRNAQVTSDLFRAFAAAEAVRAAASVQWGSRQEAERTRERLFLELDALQLTASDAMYPRLVQLAATLGDSVPGPDADLPELLDLPIDRPVPALVLAHRLYGDRGREAELVERNRARIVHPGRIATGSTLEVLSR